MCILEEKYISRDISSTFPIMKYKLSVLLFHFIINIRQHQYLCLGTVDISSTETTTNVEIVYENSTDEPVVQSNVTY